MKLRLIASVFLAALVGGIFSTAALATHDLGHNDPARMTGAEILDHGTDQPDYYDPNSDDGNDR